MKINEEALRPVDAEREFTPPPGKIEHHLMVSGVAPVPESNFMAGAEPSPEMKLAMLHVPEAQKQQALHTLHASIRKRLGTTAWFQSAGWVDKRHIELMHERMNTPLIPPAPVEDSPRVREVLDRIMGAYPQLDEGKLQLGTIRGVASQYFFNVMEAAAEGQPLPPHKQLIGVLAKLYLTFKHHGIKNSLRKPGLQAHYADQLALVILEESFDAAALIFKARAEHSPNYRHELPMLEKAVNAGFKELLDTFQERSQPGFFTKGGS